MQDYQADCDELEHPVIKDLTKLRMSTLRRFHPHLVTAHNTMCASAPQAGCIPVPAVLALMLPVMTFTRLQVEGFYTLRIPPQAQLQTRRNTDT